MIGLGACVLDFLAFLGVGVLHIDIEKTLRLKWCVQLTILGSLLFVLIRGLGGGRLYKPLFSKLVVLFELLQKSSSAKLIKC